MDPHLNAHCYSELPMSSQGCVNNGKWKMKGEKYMQNNSVLVIGDVERSHPIDNGVKNLEK